MSKPDGGAAFPRRLPKIKVPPDEAVEIIAAHAGMSLRDYFAAKAMQGLIASNDDGAGDRIDDISPYAYQIADAMLKARDE